MKIQSWKRILKTDYAKQFQDLIETLSFSINNAIDNINAALNNNISLNDNILCTVKTLNIQVDATGKPLTTLIFPLSFTGQAKLLEIGNVQNQTNSVLYPTSAVMFFWTQVQNGIQVNSITGLLVNNTYNITVVVYG